MDMVSEGAGLAGTSSALSYHYLMVREGLLPNLHDLNGLVSS